MMIHGPVLNMENEELRVKWKIFNDSVRLLKDQVFHVILGCSSCLSTSPRGSRDPKGSQKPEEKLIYLEIIRLD